ncbi:hypothetical protein [Actinomadura rudentiformis]|uniref:Uncharacterized protein n=1 Tax=Actinomadura rudentiformis TaxID=359158 RepID=A0A6H9YL43_9ACTN|nr:hypothetical protein [Actinomadura rudentiformis]KAB2343722.1 hypothetical protein F8566_33925 [Actinomadura rudentiformis]
MNPDFGVLDPRLRNAMIYLVAAIDLPAARVVNAANAARALDSANARDAARAALTAAYVADTVGAAQLTTAVRRAADAASAALQAAAVAFERPLAPPPASSEEAKGRRPVRLTMCLVGLAAAALPAAHRPRYNQEWLSLLTELPTRRQRTRQALSILRGAPHQAWVLRRPLPP